MVLTHSNVLYICIGIIQVVSSYAVKGEVPRSLLLLDRLHVNCLALFSRHLLVTLLKAGNFLFLVFSTQAGEILQNIVKETKVHTLALLQKRIAALLAGLYGGLVFLV